MNLATEPEDSRRAAFAVSADRRGLLPALVEKDFWVCWTLERLFGLPTFGPHLLFKGGTSLSKVYGAIQRFSEDIDLSLNRAFVEDGQLPDPMGATSNTQRKQRTALLVAAFHQAVTDRLLPALRADITTHLGAEGSGAEGWMLTQDARDPGTLHFAYPRAVPEALADLPLLDQVRRHKIAFYTSPWANYETARPGTLRLVPLPERLDALRADYRGMAPMFFGPSLPFEAMMQEIAALEARVNALADADPPAG